MREQAVRSLDLEADLSIDSIKRAEIVGELAQELGATGAVDELAQLKTIDAIVGWFGATPAETPTAAPEPENGRLVRLVPQVVPCEPAAPVDLTGKTVVPRQ